jgi:glycosyltransferase involved in cell wall biosynthesis
MTTLSLVLPVWNAVRYIGDALTSLERNADPDFEFLVVDDGSDDGTSEVLADFGPRLPGMTVIRHERPVGLADARNAGLEVARGTYVTYLDGDDWLAPGYLAQLVSVIDRLGVEFVRVDHVQVRGRVRTLHQAPQGRRGVALEPRASIVPSNRTTMVDYPYAWAGIYRRDLGDRLHFPGSLHTAEDRPWIWRLFRETSSYAVASLAGLFYRREVSNSLTQTADERQLHFFDAFGLVLDQLRDEPDRELHLKAARQCLALVTHHVDLGRTSRPALQKQIEDRSRELLARFGPDLLTEAMIDRRRAMRVRALLPDGVDLPRAGAA